MLLNVAMNCPHPQPFSPRRRQLRVSFPLPKKRTRVRATKASNAKIIPLFSNANRPSWRAGVSLHRGASARPLCKQTQNTLPWRCLRFRQRGFIEGERKTPPQGGGEDVSIVSLRLARGYLYPVLTASRRYSAGRIYPRTPSANCGGT